MKALCLLVFAGCTVGDRYVIDRSTAASLAAAPDRAVPATTKKGERVLVRGATLDLAGARPHGDDLEVEARVPSPMVTAGSALTWIGTALSVAGTILFFARPSGSVHAGGAGLALSAEAVMWTGTGLWIAGAARHPERVSR